LIPIRDSNPSSSKPVVNYFLIAVNILVFLIEISSPDGMNLFIYKWGLVPSRITNTVTSSYFPLHLKLISFFAFMFLHGGWFHLIGNMWFLYIFGDNIEDRLGPINYLIFYIACGLISGFTHFLFNLNSNIPVVGASGAIAGVMGAYFVLYPRAKILTLIPIIIIPWFIEIPAFIFLGFWFIIQLFHTTGVNATGIAWWAHVSGFAAGAFLLKFFNLLPEPKLSRNIQQAVRRHKTPDIITIRPINLPNSMNIFALITISREEAFSGCIKKINIPWGFYNRLYNVNIPPGVSEGTTLRMKGIGNVDNYGNKGDLMLEIRIVR